MGEIVLRFLIGGIVVSAFAVLGDVLGPKSFAGLFGAAASVALGTIPLTIAHEGGLADNLDGHLENPNSEQAQAAIVIT